MAQCQCLSTHLYSLVQWCVLCELNFGEFIFISSLNSTSKYSFKCIYAWPTSFKKNINCKQRVATKNTKERTQIGRIGCACACAMHWKLYIEWDSTRLLENGDKNPNNAQRDEKHRHQSDFSWDKNEFSGGEIPFLRCIKSGRRRVSRRSETLFHLLATTRSVVYCRRQSNGIVNILSFPFRSAFVEPFLFL